MTKSACRAEAQRRRTLGKNFFKTRRSKNESAQKKQCFTSTHRGTTFLYMNPAQRQFSVSARSAKSKFLSIPLSLRVPLVLCALVVGLFRADAATWYVSTNGTRRDKGERMLIFIVRFHRGNTEFDRESSQSEVHGQRTRNNEDGRVMTEGQ